MFHRRDSKRVVDLLFLKLVIFLVDILAKIRPFDTVCFRKKIFFFLFLKVNLTHSTPTFELPLGY